MPKKGYKQTEEHIRHSSESHKGQHSSPATEWKKGQTAINKGIPHTKITKNKCRLANLGKHYSPETEFKKGSKINLGRKRPDAILRMRKIGLEYGGKKHWNWQNGKSFEEYPQEFNKQLKEKIRTRDTHRCQECFRQQDELRTKTNRKYKLMIHHIDYNKKNNNPNNLISLCRNCHSQTNFGRDDWTNYLNKRVI